MAQLPPKAPTSTTMPPIWPNFTHQLPANSMASFLPANTHPAWLTDFHDFSSTKRCSHRHSVSDSIAFLEAHNMSDDSGRVHDFDGHDDDQVIHMFSDEVAPPSPSDHNSINDEKPGPSSEPDTVVFFDPKRVKRILANRQSAQRSRVRKLQYISELERSVTTLQTQVSALSPRVAFLDHQRSILTLGNSHLKQRIAALAQDSIFKDAHQEALKKEIERLRQVYRHQNLEKMVAPASDRAVCNDKELLT